MCCVRDLESEYFTPILPPFFRVRWIRPNGILSPPYPEVTLDNFSFLVGGRSAARRPVFRPPGQIFARKSVFFYRTPDFVKGPFVALDDIFPVNYLAKGYFFLWTTLSGRGRNMVRGNKCMFFFGSKFSDFCPKIRFLL